MPLSNEAITVASLSLAMDAASMRQEAIAANIANASTPGFHEISVDFEAQLEDARLALQNDGRLDELSLSGVQPRFVQSGDAQALGLPSKVMIDLEVAKLAQNAVQYQALAKGLSKHFEILSTAVSDGRK